MLRVVAGLPQEPTGQQVQPDAVVVGKAVDRTRSAAGRRSQTIDYCAIARPASPVSPEVNAAPDFIP